jgi:hypothetical protein
MDGILSLAYLTAVTRPLRELISVATRTGHQAVGLRLIAVTPPTPGYQLIDHFAMLRKTSGHG